jgi:hypothetical protein
MKLSFSLETTAAETGVLCEVLRGSRGASFDVGAAISAVQRIVEAYLATIPSEAPVGTASAAGATPPGAYPPPTAAKPAEDPERRNMRINRGADHYSKLVAAWCQGFGETDVEQPDRATLLREVSTGPAAGDILEYVSSMGGLLRATDFVVPSSDRFSEDERRTLVNLVASNITQVASLMFPDLADQYEHTNIYS